MPLAHPAVLVPFEMVSARRRAGLCHSHKEGRCLMTEHEIEHEIEHEHASKDGIPVLDPDTDTDEPNVADGADGGQPIAVGSGNGVSDTTILRELILRAHPDVVPELVRGETLHELLATIPDAQAAYARIVVATQTADAGSASGVVQLPLPLPIPAGGGTRTSHTNIESLSPMAKIIEGLRAGG